jgi:hypothetical protein
MKMFAVIVIEFKDFAWNPDRVDALSSSSFSEAAGCRPGQGLAGDGTCFARISVPG